MFKKCLFNVCVGILLASSMFVACSSSSTDYTEELVYYYYLQSLGEYVVIDTSSIKATNLEIYYDFEAKKASVSWADSPSSSLSHLVLHYTVGSNEEKSVQIAKGVQTYTIPLTIETGTTVKAYVVAFDSTAANAKSESTAEVSVETTLSASSISIPPAGVSGAGKTLYAVVNGANFSKRVATTVTSDSGTTTTYSGNLDTSSFSITCDTGSVVANSSVIIRNHNTLWIPLTIPSSAGTYAVTVSYNGSNGTFSQTGNLVVNDYSSVKAGDVVLSDGSSVSYSEGITYSEAQKSSAVGVIYGLNCYGVPIGVGLHNSISGTRAGYKAWSASDKAGESTSFADIKSTPSTGNAKVTSSTTFDEDCYGADNWGIICSIEKNLSSYAPAYYPAFNYAAKYGSTFALSGNYASGWYIPTISELATLFQKKLLINTVLEALGASKISDTSYWSSSQSASSAYNAWTLNFTEGYAAQARKGSCFYVCVVRTFE